MTKPKKNLLWLVGGTAVVTALIGVNLAAEPLTFDRQDLDPTEQIDSSFDSSSWREEMDQILIETVTQDFESAGGSAYGANLTLAAIDNVLMLFLEDHALGRQPNTNQYLETIFQLEQEHSVPMKQYELADLQITNRSDQKALKKYATTMGVIILEASKGTEHEVAIVSRILDGQQEEDVQQLERNVAGYENIIENALAIQVPQSVAKEHLEVVNNWQKIKRAKGYMTTLLEDPFRGVIGMRRYQQYAPQAATASIEMAKTLANKGVEFKPGDPGFAFTFWTYAE